MQSRVLVAMAKTAVTGATLKDARPRPYGRKLAHGSSRPGGGGVKMGTANGKGGGRGVLEAFSRFARYRLNL
jgi:hypothetical protein